MARVTGIGGVFFRAADPDGLTAWYRTHLGIDASAPPWHQDAGYTVFALFAEDSDYFPARFRHMLNFRVDDLDGMIAQLRATGVEAETRAEWDGDGSYGRFARIHDPEGNPIELWQPPAPPTDSAE